MKKIRITIRKDGTQQIEVEGAVGPECVEFTRELEKRLGTPLGPRQLKPEYHENDTEVERTHEVDR
jgi:hypothetical protein